MEKIDRLVMQSIWLRGDTKAKDPNRYEYGPSQCLRCREPIPAEGQGQIGLVADERGLLFRLKIPCACGFPIGFVAIDLQASEMQEENKE